MEFFAISKKSFIRCGVGAKHSDIKINALLQNLPPECFAPTVLFFTMLIFNCQLLIALT